MQEKKTRAGTEDFEKLISSNGYYVDKTRFLRPLLEDTGDVALFTRPRRFGKTLTMTMLRDFLKVDRENPGSTELQERLFNGLEVMGDSELCARFMGKHPVIFITLKDVSGLNFAEAVDSLASTVADVASEFSFLLESQKLDDLEKRRLEAFIGMQDGLGSVPQVTLQKSILNLARMLYSHYGRKAVVLVDEYDVPLAKAQRNGYHARMAELYSKFLGFLKKTSGIDPICKVVMTGCLRVAKNQIFTGANNFTPHTVLSKGFSSLFGFTPDEVEAYLGAFGLSDCMELARENYDGYRIGASELFCPWDVCNFVHDALAARAEEGDGAVISAGNYWSGSESTNTMAIKDYVRTLSREDNQRLQDLSDGREVEVEINDGMNYDCLDERNARDMWSLLLHTGYLTATRVVSGDRCVVKIPNLEIKECFDKSIMASFEETVRHGNSGARLARALLSGDADSARRIIQDLLKTYICLHALANRSRPEIFYETLLSTLLMACDGSEISNLKVEPESGDGYADIAFTSYGADQAVVIELKVRRTDGSLTEAASEAVRQIEERGYAQKFIDSTDVETVTAIGIAFCKRICRINAKLLKGGVDEQDKV